MEEPKICGTCKHFVQHYDKFGRSFRPLACGHCTSPRCRDKRADTPACARYLLQKATLRLTTGRRPRKRPFFLTAVCFYQTPACWVRFLAGKGVLLSIVHLPLRPKEIFKHILTKGSRCVYTVYAGYIQYNISRWSHGHHYQQQRRHAHL